MPSIAAFAAYLLHTAYERYFFKYPPFATVRYQANENEASNKTDLDPSKAKISTSHYY